MTVLHMHSSKDIDSLAWPEQESSLSIHSPALSVFTDFNEHMPQVVDASTKAIELEHLMKQSHVKMKLVLDRSGHFTGIVSLADLSEDKIIRKVAQGSSRDELTAADFMHRNSELQSFEYQELLNATVADVVNALRGRGEQHCLVTDHEHGLVRGVISVSDIARRLRLPLDIQGYPSFADLSKVLAA